MPAELPELLLPDSEAWRSWLNEHHSGSPGVRLVLSRKGGSVTRLDYDGALDEALCFGWIDGQVGRRDAESMFQRFQPRGRRSVWSQRNILNVERLEREGRMRAAGRAAVDAAKADGRWERAYAGPAAAVLPSDLLEAIRAVPEAQAMFEVLTSQNRYALYFRLNHVTSADARSRRIAAFVEQLARHEPPHPQRKLPDSPPRP
jgi:uncharacterized protein YdeI (YjbR/CyaY-like superfamily)